MREIEIRYFPDLAESPAKPLVIDAHKELAKAGLTQGETEPNVNKNAWVAAAFDGEECVGFIAHSPYFNVNAIWIEQAYVKPSHRRRGIHAMMFERVVAQARIEGLKSVQSGTHVNNEKSRASMEKQGRKVFGLFYKYDVPGIFDNG